MAAVVKSLHFYPVKSCRGVDLQEAQIVERGILNDRSWLITSKSGLAVTQRDYPKLALVEAQMSDSETLRLAAPGMKDIEICRVNDGSESKARVWDDDCVSINQGAAASAWFSKFLDFECSLVSMKEGFVRSVSAKYATASEQQVGFADGFPFLLISEASLDDLNEKLEYPVLMNRFRPNIVVSGCDAFAEDAWKSIRIGQIKFDIVKPCARCVIVTIDQSDAVLGKEPMRTLSAYRKEGSKVLFGQNLVHHSNGVLRISDSVEVLQMKS